MRRIYRRNLDMQCVKTLALLPLLLVFARAVVQKFVREPPDQTAAVGEHVTLPCRVESKLGKIQWTRDDFGLGLNRNLKVPLILLIHMQFFPQESMTILRLYDKGEEVCT